MNRRSFIVGAAALAAARSFASHGAKEKVVLDTDIGVDIDDAIALSYLLAEPRCDLVGVTTVGGRPELRAEMASAVCTAFGRPDIPIHPGEDRALVYKRKPLDPALARTLGGLPRKKFAADGSAVAFLRRTLRENPGEITLVAVAPFTNVARLFLSDPEAAGLLKGVVAMGGRFFSEVPKPEWNIMCDPEATVVAFGPGGCGRVRETVFHGLDVTADTVRKPKELLELVRGTASLAFLAPSAELYFATHPCYEESGKALHDPLACVSMFHPGVCAYRRGHARFTLGGDDIVHSRFVEDPNGRQLAATSADVAKFYDILRQTMSAERGK
ncbi:MAG: nucleoside hydrolase [Kiritimatiellae bacterium]|nr:nucleoside hydrolase [Kiritimatiellia bacterium]